MGYLDYFRNCPQKYATGPHWWWVNIGAGNGLVPSGNKSLLEPTLTQTYVAIWHHWATLITEAWTKCPPFCSITFYCHLFNENHCVMNQISPKFVSRGPTGNKSASVNSSDARDGIFRLWRSIPCLLIHWLLKSPVHQQAWHWQYRIGST